jgi:hypothetical protein
VGRLTFTTFAAIIDAAEASTVRRQARELLEVRWVPRGEILGLVAPRLRERLSQLLDEI